MATANLAVRFLAELLGVAAIGYAGFQLAAPMPIRIVAGIGAAIALIATWAVVVAPNAANGLTQPQKDLIGTAVLLLAAGALAIAGQMQPAIAFALLIVANAALLFVFGQGAREALGGMSR